MGAAMLKNDPPAQMMKERIYWSVVWDISCATCLKYDRFILAKLDFFHTSYFNIHCSQ